MSAERALDARLTVVLDVRHPFSYLALAPTSALVDETGVAADWLPIRALTLSPPSAPGPGDDRGIRHRRFRAEMIAREIAVYADAQRLAIEAPYRDGPADALHAAWLWLRGAEPARLRVFLEQAFRRYWSQRLDPQSPVEIAALLDDLGLDGARFGRWTKSEGSGPLAAAAARVAELGVAQGPGYAIDGEVFLGRQHLPMIRWLLGGRSGDLPI